MTATLEAPAVEPEATSRVQRVEDLPDPIRADIVARRQAGETFAELKKRFGHVAPEVIREVLPPANKREADQRKAKEAKPKAAEVKEPQVTKGKAAEPKAPRYSTDADLVTQLAERAVACRQVMGRAALAEALGMTGSAVWRAEHGRIHPDELEPLHDGLAAAERRIAAGEFVKAERAPRATAVSKADLTHRVEVAAELLRTARGDKSITKAALVDSALAVLDPQAPAQS
jgi:hypothetical protein